MRLSIAEDTAPSTTLVAVVVTKFVAISVTVSSCFLAAEASPALAMLVSSKDDGGGVKLGIDMMRFGRMRGCLSKILRSFHKGWETPQIDHPPRLRDAQKW